MIENNKLIVLERDKDKYGFDIREMTNFLTNYINLSLSEISRQSPLIKDIRPIYDINLIKETLIVSSKIFDHDIYLVPNFKDLPKDILEKLKNNTYKIGQSKQVVGDFRSVILDENNVRVKDITLKRVSINKDFHPEMNNIINQLELKNINEKLDLIVLTQKYQIDKSRQSTLFVPFFTARDYIVQAQNEKISKKKIELYEKAGEYLLKSFNETECDINLNRKHFIEYIGRRFNRNKIIQTFINYISEDFYLLTINVGFQLLVFNNLGKIKDAENLLNKYEKILIDFSQKTSGDNHLSGFELLHDYCEYSRNSIDSWLDFSDNVKKFAEEKCQHIECNEMVLLCLEDSKNEQ